MKKSITFAVTQLAIILLIIVFAAQLNHHASASNTVILPTFMDADPVAGIIDGANRTFKLAHVPVPVQSIQLYRNGLLQKRGQDFDLMSSTLTITFVLDATPQPGDTLQAWYRY